MKNLFTAIRSAFCGKNYTAQMVIAGQEITVTINAPDYRRALEEAEHIVDDCGFIIGVSEVNPASAPVYAHKAACPYNGRSIT